MQTCSKWKKPGRVLIIHDGIFYAESNSVNNEATVLIF